MIYRRLVVWSAEALAAAFLLGVLFGVLSVPDLKTFVTLLPAVWALAFGVGGILFLHGYYVTTALAGVVWRSQRLWLYPAIAATLFVVHSSIVFFRLQPLSSSGRAAALPFLVCGASIVFVCSFIGNLILRKWIRPKASSNLQEHGSVPSSG
jgi:hypothetical protein